MARIFGVYASGKRVYSGDFSEVPRPHRERLVEAIEQWGDVISGGGLNELLYSFLCWHDETVFCCAECGSSGGSGGRCDCGGMFEQKPKYEKNEKISRILMCVGSINRVVVEEDG